MVNCDVAIYHNGQRSMARAVRQRLTRHQGGDGLARWVVTSWSVEGAKEIVAYVRKRKMGAMREK